MEAHVRAPEPLSDKKPMDKTWRMWKQEFIIFLKAAGFDKKPGEEKALFFMNKVGPLGFEAMENMEFDDEEEKQDYEILMQKFDEYFDPPKREIEERQKFYSRSKKNNEPIEAFVADLKEKAKTCNFGDLTDSLVRDMVILDIKDKHLRQIALQEKDLDLNKLIMIYKQFQLNTEKMKDVTKKATSENQDTKSKDSNSSETKNPKNICGRCGTSHAPRNCPAFHATCEKCNEKGHFTQRCHNKSRGNPGKNVNLNQKDVTKNKNYTKNPFGQIDKSKNKN